MLTKIPTLNMTHEEWLQRRKTGIGGSDAGAICGLNPYVSPMGVYLDKISTETTDLDNEAMRQGRDLEEYVARRFTEAIGLKVRKSNMMYVNSRYPFMLADVDRLVVGEDAGLEWKDGEIPPHYVIQCYHYMAVTGRKNWYIAVVVLGQGFQYRKLSWDEEMIRNLISIEDDFWNSHVLKRVMPDPDGSNACDEVLEQYFHHARKGTAVPLIGFDEKLNRRQEIVQLMKKLEQEQKQIEQEIKLYMKDNESAFNERYRITWTNVDTARLDTKRVKEEKPEVYRQFMQTTSSRRFTVKAA